MVHHWQHPLDLLTRQIGHYAVPIADAFGHLVGRLVEIDIEQRGELSVSDVFAERNAETRRAGCTLLGWERVLAGIDAKLINDDGDPQIGALYEGQIPGAARCGFLRVECGTRRQFVIPVPAGLKTAIEAQAWVQNVPESKWIKPEVRG